MFIAAFAERINMKGFTLIELLVTVGIISLLSAGAIANFNSFRTKAANLTAQVQSTHMNTFFEGITNIIMEEEDVCSIIISNINKSTIEYNITGCQGSNTDYTRVLNSFFNVSSNENKSLVIYALFEYFPNVNEVEGNVGSYKIVTEVVPCKGDSSYYRLVYGGTTTSQGSYLYDASTINNLCN